MHKIPKIELNEFIEKFSEIKPLLDQYIEDVFIDRVLVVNNGCKSGVTLKVFRYLHNHDISTKNGKY